MQKNECRISTFIKQKTVISRIPKTSKTLNKCKQDGEVRQKEWRWTSRGGRTSRTMQDMGRREEVLKKKNNIKQNSFTRNNWFKHMTGEQEQKDKHNQTGEPRKTQKRSTPKNTRSVDWNWPLTRPLMSIFLCGVSLTFVPSVYHTDDKQTEQFCYLDDLLFILELLLIVGTYHHFRCMSEQQEDKKITFIMRSLVCLFYIFPFRITPSTAEQWVEATKYVLQIILLLLIGCSPVITVFTSWR